MVTSNGHTVAGLVTKDAPFDPVKDFAGITRLGSAPLFLITHPDVPAKTLKEVIELAKKEPGKLNFSSPGLASTTFIAGALFRKHRRHQHRPRAVPQRARRGDRGDPRRCAVLFRAGQPGARSVRGRQGEGDRGRDRQAHSGNAERADLHRSGTAVRL